MWFRVMWCSTSPKKRDERVEPAMGSGVAELENGMDVPTQAAPCPGPARRRSLDRAIAVEVDWHRRGRIRVGAEPDSPLSGRRPNHVTFLHGQAGSPSQLMPYVH